MLHCISSDLGSSYTTAKSEVLSRYVSIIILVNPVYHVYYYLEVSSRFGLRSTAEMVHQS
jgi:hypothetical protein